MISSNGSQPVGQIAKKLVGRGCEIELNRPRLMGILNLTPDSFFDGGRYNRIEDALRQVEKMEAEGADLIDVGGESTRPGAEIVSVEEELSRVIPVVERLSREFDLPLSVDTTKARVAREGLASGASFINDISGLTFDPDLLSEVVTAGAGLFLMHTPGRPDRMQQQADYQDVCHSVLQFLQQSLIAARAAGMSDESLAVDPGIGFGKGLTDNLKLLNRLGELSRLGVPILLGTSRKSFIGQALGQDDPADRLYGTLATVALGVSNGAMIHRVHDVRPARDVAMMAWAIRQG